MAKTPEQTALARAAAEAGIESFEKGNYKEALDRFERAERMLHATSHLLHQARCHEKLGDLVRARELYIKIAREVLPPDAPQAFRDAQKTAQEELPALESRVPYMTLTVKGAGAEVAAVTVDGVAVPNDILGLPFPINPGSHEVVVKAPDGKSKTQSVQLTEGKREQVELSLAHDEPGLAVPAEMPTSSAVSTSNQSNEPYAKRGTWMKPAGYVALGTGVVGAAVGTGMYLRGASKHSDANDVAADCKPDCSDSKVSQINDLDAQAKSAGLFAALGFAVGGVGITAGITLLVLSPKSTEQVAITPFVTPNSAGLVGRF